MMVHPAINHMHKIACENCLIVNLLLVIQKVYFSETVVSDSRNCNLLENVFTFQNIMTFNKCSIGGRCYGDITDETTSEVIEITEVSWRSWNLLHTVQFHRHENLTHSLAHTICFRTLYFLKGRVMENIKSHLLVQIALLWIFSTVQIYKRHYYHLSYF